MRHGPLFRQFNQPFRPFPRLWEAFAPEPEIVAKLDRDLFSFDQLNHFGMTHATRGVDAARKEILDTKPGWTDKWTPAPPRVDISDFPDRA